MCGASRTSICELDANVPKVNSAADRKPPVRRFGASVCSRKNGRFVNPLRNLPAQGGNPHTNQVLRCNTTRSAPTVAPRQHPKAPKRRSGCVSGMCAWPWKPVIRASHAVLAIQRSQAVLGDLIKVEFACGHSFALEGKPHMGYYCVITKCIRCGRCCRYNLKMTGAGGKLHAEVDSTWRYGLTLTGSQFD